MLRTDLIESSKLIRDLSEQKELVWINNKKVAYSEYEKNLPITDEQIKNAEELLIRFSPFIKKVFPETESANGIIESPIKNIGKMKKELEKIYDVKIAGEAYLKMDSHLAIAGSIKARGGVYEVLKHAEDLAIENALLTLEDDYSILAETRFREFFSQYKVQVGSTGNLGLSIGIISATLGFKVIVHMSADAKKWKKDLLRSKGVEVLEYAGDYTKAVDEGRKVSDSDSKSYFVDDEKSINLFLGCCVAASRLKKQLEENNIFISKEKPLIVYLPCGIGGAPGGVSYGLKRVFKENVHCFFVEPTLVPCVILGIETELYEKIPVKDIGLDGITHADGLAVPRASRFFGKILEGFLSGIFTVKDYRLYDYLRILKKTEDVTIEPSSCSSFDGLVNLMKYEDSKKYIEENIGKNIENAYHICWATGGKLVPEEDMNKFLKTFLEEK